MRLITYRRDATVGPALLKDGHVFPLSPLGYPDALSFIAAGPKRWAGVNLQLDETGPNLLASLSSVTLEAPLLRPPKILCIGLNYRDHAAESKMEPPKFPTVFTKYPHTLIGNGQAIVLPRASQQPDYEAEFAVVIGQEAAIYPKRSGRTTSSATPSFMMSALATSNLLPPNGRWARTSPPSGR